MPCGCRSVQVGRYAPNLASIVRLALQATPVTTDVIINAPIFTSNFLSYLGFWIVDLINCVAHSGGQLTGRLRIRLEVPPIVYVLHGSWRIPRVRVGSGTGVTDAQFSQTLHRPTTVTYYSV